MSYSTEGLSLTSAGCLVGRTVAGHSEFLARMADRLDRTVTATMLPPADIEDHIGRFRARAAGERNLTVREGSTLTLADLEAFLPLGKGRQPR